MYNPTKVRAITRMIKQTNAAVEHLAIKRMQTTQNQEDIGNIGIERIDDSLPTLAINLQQNRYLVGSDSVSKDSDKINKHIAKKHKRRPGKADTQNTRFICETDSELLNIFKFYATLGN